jgi:predicted phosphodiesterase
MKSIRLAVISDLHYSKQPATEKIMPEMGHLVPREPMTELLTILERDSITADYLLCPGDITNHADSAALKVGWERLNNLQFQLKAKQLIASTGNHEVTSRIGVPENSNNPELSIDPLEHLIRTKDYPTKFDNEDKKWIYWGRGFEIIDNDDAVIVIVNSCHAHATTRAIEYERGKISDTTIDCLKEALDSYKNSKKFKILLMHHNPAPIEALPELGRTPTYNGDNLIRMLGKHLSPWLIIHGHKHFPEIFKASGSGNPPIIFSAGSFGAAISGETARISRNQFYILTLELHENSNFQRLRGKFEAFHFDISSWTKSKNVGTGLPYGCGFAHNSDITDICQKIKSYAEDYPVAIGWETLSSSIPELKYLMPGELEIVKESLRELQVIFSSDSESYFPTEVFYTGGEVR